tara:strand:+ start:241 stop:705 length:465 start_codon:yes stop_codon:yes gene_type:complete
MLIAQIHALFSKFSPLHVQNRRCASIDVLASYGIIGQDYQVISESGFNQLINSLDQSCIVHRDNSTLICDAKDRVHALVKAAYFDASGQSQPVRYFALEKAKLAPLSIFQLRVKRLTKHSLRNIITRLNAQAHRPLVPASKKTPAVWTTIRVTA